MSRAHVCELRASVFCDNQNKNREKLCSTVQSPFGMVWQARCIFLASVNAVPRSASFEEICRAVSDTSPRGHARAAESNDKIKKTRFHNLLITRPASPFLMKHMSHKQLKIGLKHTKGRKVWHKTRWACLPCLREAVLPPLHAHATKAFRGCLACRRERERCAHQEFQEFGHDEQRGLRLNSD